MPIPQSSRPIITRDELQQLVSFDKHTGVFHWKVSVRSRGGLTRIGNPVGHVGLTGYVRIILRGREYSAHRLAWFYVHGTWPQYDIDHRNGVRHDNRISNLRDVTDNVNQQNRQGAASNCQSGLIGAWPASNGDTKKSKPWRSAIKVGDTIVFLGYFDTAELAHGAYIKAKRKFHEGCTI